VRELFKYKDGGMIAIDWALDFPRTDDNKPLLVLMPGLGGDNSFAYIISMAEQAIANGYSVVIIGYRGASGIPLQVI